MLLNALYDAGNTVGPILCYVFIFMMFIELCIVWVKHVMTTDK